MSAAETIESKNPHPILYTFRWGHREKNNCINRIKVDDVGTGSESDRMRILAVGPPRGNKPRRDRPAEGKRERDEIDKNNEPWLRRAGSTAGARHPFRKARHSRSIARPTFLKKEYFDCYDLSFPRAGPSFIT